jgi:hypothetical protein
MRQITAARLKTTLDKISKRLHTLTDEDGAVIRKAALLGLRSVCGVATQTDVQKFDLELDYHGASKDRFDLEFRMARFTYQIDRFNRRRDIVYHLQEQHKISGLTEGSLTVGEKTIPIMVQDEELGLIDNDLVVLWACKQTIVDEWIIYTIKQYLPIWVRRDDDWQVSSIGEVQDLSSPHDWAKCWDHGDEVHLDIGSGLFPDDANTPRDWFCACRVKPCL